MLTLDRVELADITGGPEVMARAVHRQIGRMTGAVPIERIACALDITEIRKTELDGCEGVLFTDRMRNHGKILVNTRGGASRARFSVAHELGHFLLESHVLSGATGFICSKADMQEGRGATRHQRQEREANRFAIEMLAPTYRIAPHLTRESDLRTVGMISRDLEISREAAARRYVELHEEPLAAVFSRQGIVRYCVRSDRFPWIKLNKGDRISSITPAHRAITAGKAGITRFAEATSAAWTDAADVELHEQTRIGRNAFAITLLRASSADPDTDDDDLGLEELGTPRFR